MGHLSRSLHSGWPEKRRIRDVYNASADVYDEAYELEQAAKHQAALKLAPPNKGEVALDLGCGPGHLLRLLAVEAELAVGADLSMQLLKLAARRADTQRNIALVCCDAEYLPFTPRTFQTAYAVTVLQNLPSPERCLREARSVVSTSGKVIVGFLKKSFQRRDAKELLDSTGFRLEALVESTDLKDLLAVCAPTFGD